MSLSTHRRGGMKPVSGLSGEVWGRWGWGFVVGWMMAGVSWYPAFYPTATGMLASFHILFIILLLGGVTLLVLSVTIATQRYYVLKRQSGG